MGILDSILNAGPSDEEIRRMKGENLFGGCPFCGDEVEARKDIGVGIEIRCTACLSLWIRSGTLTGRYECIRGPSEYEGAEKHRKAWKSMNRAVPDFSTAP